MSRHPSFLVPALTGLLVFTGTAHMVWRHAMALSDHAGLSAGGGIAAGLLAGGFVFSGLRDMFLSQDRSPGPARRYSMPRRGR